MAAEGRSSRTQRASPSSCGGSRPAASSLRPGSTRSWLRQSQTSERAAHPCAGLAGCGLQFFRLPHHPPLPPRPLEGLELRRGAFEPGAHRGSPGRRGGSRLRQQWPAAAVAAHPAQRGAGAARWPGAMGWGPRQLPRGHARARAHAHSLTHTHTQALTPPPAALLPQNLQSPPLE